MIQILDQSGIPIVCACGQPAMVGWVNTLGQMIYYCPAHDPTGQPCPLCEGSGKITTATIPNRQKGAGE